MRGGYEPYRKWCGTVQETCGLTTAPDPIVHVPPRRSRLEISQAARRQRIATSSENWAGRSANNGMGNILRAMLNPPIFP